MQYEFNQNEFANLLPAVAAVELQEIIITAGTDETTTDSSIPLGTKAVEQAILSAGSDLPPEAEQITEHTVIPPTPDEAPRQSTDNIKKPPTPPVPPTAIGSPDEGGDDHENHGEAREAVAEPVVETPSTQADRPVSTMPDELDLGGWGLREASDGFSRAAIDVHKKVDAMADGNTSEAMQTDIVHQVALRDLMAAAVLDPEEAAYEASREAAQTASFDRRVENVDFEDLMAQAGHLSPDEVIDYFVGKLESYTKYLATGEQPNNWPEADSQGGLTGNEISRSIRLLTETVQLAIDSLGDQLENGEALAQRHQDWTRETASLLLSEGRIGLAAPLINSMNETNTAAAMDELQGAMTSLRESGDEEDYRSMYSSVAHSLKGENLTAFVEQNQRLEAPEIPGAQREVYDYGSHRVAVDRFDAQQPFTVRLAGGDQTQLPYANSIERELSRYGQPTETQRYAVQHQVRYDDLDAVAKAAIETAWEAADQERLRVETMPDYKRLVLKPGEEGEPSALHTMTLRDGFTRTVDEYPDHHGYLTAETESQIDRPVSSAQAVSSGYMVVPNRGDYTPQTAYVDAEANFFGPGAGEANAFWISGNPRRVVDTPYSIKYRRYEDVEGGEPARSRWIIFPVTYYKVEEQRPAEDTSEDRPRYGI